MPHSWSGGFGEEKNLLPLYDRYGEFFLEVQTRVEDINFITQILLYCFTVH